VGSIARATKQQEKENGMSTTIKQAPLIDNRRPWGQPSLKTIGTIDEVVRGGGGKLSTVGGDPGEFRKQAPVG
jgi:hypothetical protein